ncbi:MAG: hypothetical protein COV74_05580 [Candidatus Omnitrophica bacterium CG11_big_fil_rev_8_21_14_0_20_45_26]|uniref:Uncharacterized protein n=1 Tax=Candidatus Abzuiibacterium crystallinum TaxID=1974748 RepID=A0A2H0LNY7_9BACT|nr:MAG: hypothetical protein COV74_05580 [Candidatus Omnitrophica bacterium CG11_big_fil_rev_8_21_14_0_20_45_26]PIW65280.1 MAG: hypothetical protein COW12_02780 [Candidatus Omnitrophica bacterium CG12_big_fil_rev_8_21_14_0_65_45_16]
MTETFMQKLDLRKTLILVIIFLGAVTLNDQWQNVLEDHLEHDREELAESRMLINANVQFQSKQEQVEKLKNWKQQQDNFSNWKDSIPGIVTDQKLILRQVRPLGIVEQGRQKEEKLFVQVDGSMDGVIGFLNHIALLDLPIYVSRYLISTRTVGSGFVTVEIVLSRLMI